jgi:RNA polymerase sigma factor (TIGR02999 family)
MPKANALRHDVKQSITPELSSLSSGVDRPMNLIKDDQAKADVTTLLQRIRVGDADALSEIVPLIYDELHAIAGKHMHHERQDHTLQATVLVSEAFMRLAGNDKIDWHNRAHFFAIASRKLGRVLIDHARAARAEKRPGAHWQIERDSDVAAIGERSVDLLALDEALAKLASWDSRRVRFSKCDSSLSSDLMRLRRRWPFQLGPSSEIGQWPVRGYTLNSQNPSDKSL